MVLRRKSWSFWNSKDSALKILGFVSRQGGYSDLQLAKWSWKLRTKGRRQPSLRMIIQRVFSCQRCPFSERFWVVIVTEKSRTQQMPKFAIWTPFQSRFEDHLCFTVNGFLQSSTPLFASSKCSSQINLSIPCSPGQDVNPLFAGSWYQFSTPWFALRARSIQTSTKQEVHSISVPRQSKRITSIQTSTEQEVHSISSGLSRRMSKPACPAAQISSGLSRRMSKPACPAAQISSGLFRRISEHPARSAV